MQLNGFTGMVGLLVGALLAWVFYQMGRNQVFG